MLNSLINNSLDIIQLLYEADELDIKDNRRLELLREVKAKLKIIGFLASIAKDALCFTTYQHDVILEKIGVFQSIYKDITILVKRVLNIYEFAKSVRY